MSENPMNCAIWDEEGGGEAKWSFSFFKLNKGNIVNQEYRDDNLNPPYR